MRTINIPSGAVRANAHYIRHVIEQGHVPGVLSGAELKGKAKHRHGANYAASRKRAIEIVHEATGAWGVAVTWGYHQINSRLAKVWQDEHGNRVALALT